MTLVRSQKIRWYIFLASIWFSIILFSIVLADALYELTKPTVTLVPIATKVPEVKKKLLAAQVPKMKVKKFISEGLDDLDRDTFLVSFERQAQESLTSCLRSSLGQGTLLLNGVLSRSGHFRKVGQMSAMSNNSLDNLPDCARVAILKMDFSKLTLNFRADFLEIQWRVDF